MRVSYSHAREMASYLGISTRQILQLCSTQRDSFRSAKRSAHTPACLTSPDPDWMREATLYLHWPYCQRRCTYCNFNKYIDTNVDHQRMRECLVKETETLLGLSQVKRIKSVFFGGGTPSLAEPKTLASVLEAISGKVELSHEAEVTLEANPTQLEANKLREFHAAGINRVSLGIQALSGRDLHVLGRDHSVADGMRSLSEAKNLFPGRTSVDLIFGRPGQTPREWEQELKMVGTCKTILAESEMLNLCDDHISLYQLTLERGTALFKQVMQGDLVLPGADVMADMYEAAVQILSSHSFSRYEVSNFARNGAESEHNKSYWKADQYIGVGPGAHGRFVVMDTAGHPLKQARIQTLEPIPWMREVECYGHATRKATSQSQLDILSEVLMLGLRTKNGISEECWRRFSPEVKLWDIFSADQYINTLMEEGLLVLDQRVLRASEKGLNVLDQITPHILNILQAADLISDSSSGQKEASV